jgi:hypothetical protein
MAARKFGRVIAVLQLDGLVTGEDVRANLSPTSRPIGRA